MTMLIIDGSDGPDPYCSQYSGDGEFPPFAVFDEHGQENLACDLPTRGAAEKLRSMLRQHVDHADTWSPTITNR